MENTTENKEVQDEAVVETDTPEEESEIHADAEHVADEHLSKEEVKEEAHGDEFKEKYFYLAAEMQNMEKRFQRDKEQLLKFGNEKLLKDMLDIVDNLERTLGFINKDEDEKVKNIVVGIEMIQKMFIESLSKHGLKQIEALGKEFDPNFHEALAQQPAEGKKDMEVIQVHQNGYTLNDRVIRAAKVIVAKN